MIEKLITSTLFTVTVLISSAALADYPVGVQDKFTVTEGTGGTFYVLRNDIGENLRVLSSNAWTVKGGRTILRPFEKRKRAIIYYTPANFVGEDEFWYVFEDEKGRTNAAKVIVTVRPAGGDILDPQDDSYEVQTGSSLRIDVQENDGSFFEARYRTKISDFNAWSQKGGRIEPSDFDSLPAWTGVRNPPRTFLTYQPPANGFTGTDEFWYVIKQGDDGIGYPAKVSVRVTQNDSSGPYPVGKPDNLKFIPSNSDDRAFYYPLDNDIGKGLRIIGSGGYKDQLNAWSEKGGRYKVEGGYRMSYTPPANFNGQDRVWYSFEDQYGRKNYSVINFNVNQ